MCRAMFDTLEYAESLESAGFDKKQAKVLTNAQFSLVNHFSIEIDGLNHEISGLRYELHKEISEVHKEIGNVKDKIGDLKGEISKSTTRLSISLGVLLSIYAILSNLDKISLFLK